MSGILGGVVGGIGSLFGGQSAKSNDLTGFNYLSQDPANLAAQGAVPSALAGQTTALGQEGNINQTEQALLTGGPNSAAANSAFNNYLNSTGYQFQLGQGTQAITGSAAAKGILNSGDTAKALTQYGQGLGSQYFNNYLTQLGGAAGQAGNTASGYGSQAGLGVNAAQSVGQAGTTGGVAAGTAMGNAIGSATGQLQGIVTSPQMTNFFGGI